jgi:YD repeat-containing protein
VVGRALAARQLKLERDALGRIVKATVDEHGGPIVTERRARRASAASRARCRTTRRRRARRGTFYDAKGRRVERTLAERRAHEATQYDALGGPSA